MAENTCSGRKIMICVDGSDHSKKAFDWYAEHIARDGDELLVVTAPELHPPALPHALATEEWHHEVEKHQEKVNAILQYYEKAIKDKCGKCKHGVVKTIGVNYSVGHALCDEAKNSHVTMVVVGSRGLGTIRRTLLGSISDYIIHHAHCPVVVVPKQ
ncbi:uncharacterized protein LOC110232359 [Exaiptasia diaphana]|uniref:UspA domain-containing protein n=1 Tax=Exaiptasia diaphana TaxID=2652724 RepID=A0A913WRY1_EXADI|nr:uncharacterized protein LOC110232359 [Exaiptasia diaphana]KXJ28020.1 Universal stress protein YxiE [Exaiptasia diaphana]